jgi:ATP-dependent helicase/nuclease subunit A
MLPRGAARIAGLRRLLAIAEARDLRLSEWVAHLQARREEGDDEATGLALDASDDAVSIMTVHAAKGLEFPIVFVVQAELGASDRDHARVVVGRTRGRLALATAIQHALARGQGLVGRRMRSERGAALRAERQRLTYVALTRAASRLYVVASPVARAARDSMMPALEAIAARSPTLVARPTWPIDPTLDDEPDIAHARVATSDATVVTTALLDFIGCPRRFRLVHLDGLDDAIALESSADAIDPIDATAATDDDETAVLLAETSSTPVVPLTLDRRALGTLAHRALERAPLTPMSATDARAWVTELLRGEGYQADDETGRRLVARVARFLASPYARSLAESGVRCAREVPFVVPMPSGARLRGTIDLVVRRDPRPEAARPRLEVIDYKLGRGGVEAIEHYRPQLEAYAVAVAAGASADADAIDVTVGLVFLGSDDPAPIWLPLRESVQALTARIDGAAGALLEARAKAEFPGVSRDRCDAIGCGFVALCHGA